MVVCRFWQQGNCKFGSTCRNEHPDQDADPNANKSGFNNRFAPLQSNSNPRNYNTQRGGDGAHMPFSLDNATIKQDLTAERPQWILSAYGPGRHAPEQLFGGPAREISFEEMRLLHYIAAASGNAQPAIQDAERLWQEADQQIQNALNDLDGAINYIVAADNKHPNRNDLCQQGTSTDQTPWVQRNNPTSGSNGFGAPSQTATLAFGQPSTQSGSVFGQPSSAFGGPSQSFGAVQQGASGAFGQPSALGQKPSTFCSAFGQPSQLEQRAGAFGNPSAMGQTANPFGAPSNNSANAGQSGFSNFGTSNAFGQPNLNPLGDAFSSNPLPPGLQQSQVNPMAQGTNPLVQANPFGQPSSANPFGSNSGSSQPFGAPSLAPKNPFGASSSQPMNRMQNQFTNTGSQAQQFGNQQDLGNLNMIAGAPSALGVSDSKMFSPNFRPPPPDANTIEHPPAESYIRLSPDGQILASFNGLPVEYKNGEPGTNINGKWYKIWCPRGYPGPNNTTELENAVFDEKTTTAYLQARHTGAFPGGVMPMIPPKREWCLWNF